MLIFFKLLSYWSPRQNTKTDWRRQSKKDFCRICQRPSTFSCECEYWRLNTIGKGKKLIVVNPKGKLWEVKNVKDKILKKSKNVKGKILKIWQ